MTARAAVGGAGAAVGPRTAGEPRAAEAGHAPTALVWCRRWLATAAAAGLALVAVPGAAGPAAAVVLAALAARWDGRWPQRAARSRAEAVLADLPLALDLLAACLCAGCSPRRAAGAVATVLDGPLAEDLRRVERIMALGGDDAEAWALLGAQPETAALGRVLSRAVACGAPVADAVSRLADEQVAVAALRAQARMRRAAVQLAGPLGLCFLPGFLLLGVAPLLVGLAGFGLLPLIRG